MGRVFQQGDDLDIEFVAPNPTAFGTAYQSDEVSSTRAGSAKLPGEFGSHGQPGAIVSLEAGDQDRRGRRWRSSAAGVAMTAVLVGGAITAAPWEVERGAPPVTSAAPATSVPTRDPAAPAGLGSDPPGRFGGSDPSIMHGLRLDPVAPGFSAVAARTTIGHDGSGISAASGLHDEATGWGEVWASPGATRTAGTWFSAAILPTAVELPGGGAERITVDGHRGFLVADADGVLHLAIDLSESARPQALWVSSFGRSGDDLIDLAASVVPAAGEVYTETRLAYTRVELLDGLDMIASGPTTADLADAILSIESTSSTTWYRSESDELIAVALLRESEPNPALAAISATSVNGLWPGTVSADTLAVDDLEIGRRAFGETMLTVASWLADGDAVAMITTLSPEATVELVGSVTRANAADWTRLADEIALNRMSRTARIGLSATIASGTFSDGTPWSTKAWPDDVVYRITEGARSADDRFVPIAGADVVVHTGPSGSVVLARDDPGSASMLRVATLNGITEAALLPVFVSDSQTVLASIAFDAEGPFLVELVDETGAAVVSYASARSGLVEGGA